LDVTGGDLWRRLVRPTAARGSGRRARTSAYGAGACFTTIPLHAGEDLGVGLLAQIRRDLEPCLGKGWMES
jgi:predicted RNA binding protein YcfA (HicA-like mRNA interferase family)